MFGRLFGNVVQTQQFQSHELRILEFLIQGGGAKHLALLAQARSSPAIVRAISKGNYEARISYLNDDSQLLNNDVELISPTISMVDKHSGKELLFSTKVLRGGFLFGLIGRTECGTSWPKSWSVDYPRAGAEPDTPPRDWLESKSDFQSAKALESRISELFNWAGGDVSELSAKSVHGIKLRQAAATGEVEDCEKGLQVVFPSAYREFLALTNGLSLQRKGRPYEILGLNDLEFIGEEGRWLGITPLYENGYVVLDSESGECFIFRRDNELVPVGDFKRHVRESIAWETGDEENKGVSDGLSFGQ